MRHDLSWLYARHSNPTNPSCCTRAAVRAPSALLTALLRRSTPAR